MSFLYLYSLLAAVVIAGVLAYMRTPVEKGSRPCRNYLRTCEEAAPPELYGGLCHCCAVEALERGGKNQKKGRRTS